MTLRSGLKAGEFSVRALNSTLICVALSLAVAAVAIYLSWDQGRQVHDFATGSMAECPLSVETETALGRLTSGVGLALLVVMFTLGGKVVAAFGALLLLGNLVEASLLRLVGRLIGDFAVSGHHPLDTALSRRLLFLGTVALFVAAVVLLALPQEKLSLGTAPAVVGVGIAAFVLGAVVLVWKYWLGFLRRSPNARLQVTEYLGSPFRRLKLWIAAIVLATITFVVLDAGLQWTFAEARMFPNQLEARLNVLMAPDALADLERRINADAKAADNEESTYEACQAGRELVAWLGSLPERGTVGMADWSAEFSPRRATEIGRAVMQVVSVALAVSCAAVVMCPVLLLGARGRRSVVLAAAALLPLPTLFFLDRMGVTSSLPWLWVAVYAPFAVSDATVSMKVPSTGQIGYWIDGRLALHSTVKCPSLRAVSSARIRSADWGAMVRLGFSRCKRCTKA